MAGHLRIKTFWYRCVHLSASKKVENYSQGKLQPDRGQYGAEVSAALQNGEAAAAPAAKAPVPRRTAPERKRKPPAALLDNDSEGSSPPALALNGSPRPGAKRKRSVLMPKRGRPSNDSEHSAASLRVSLLFCSRSNGDLSQLCQPSRPSRQAPVIR